MSEIPCDCCNSVGDHPSRIICDACFNSAQGKAKCCIDAQAENKQLKEALELAYEAYKDQCTGKVYTVKQIARVHRLCKQALQETSNEKRLS